MKKMRLPIIIALSVALLGVLLGSFFDLQISQSIASATNGFGLAMSAIGTTFGFSATALISGGFLALGLKKDFKIYFRILFFLAAAVIYGGSVYYSGGEYFGVNGFHEAAPVWVGYLIVCLPLAGAVFLGYWLMKDTTHPYAWVILLIGFAVAGIGLLAGINGLKGIFHRPRFRAIEAAGIPFHAWWQRCTDYKELMETHNLGSDEFKSFPSGHTGEASLPLIAFTLLPLLSQKLRKIQIPLFICGGALVLITAFARILAAAHFLSDVSMGATIMITCLLVANEVVMRIKPLQIEENAE